MSLIETIRLIGLLCVGFGCLICCVGFLNNNKKIMNIGFTIDVIGVIILLIAGLLSIITTLIN